MYLCVHEWCTYIKTKLLVNILYISSLYDILHVCLSI